jgi:hypothetical protein
VWELKPVFAKRGSKNRVQAKRVDFLNKKAKQKLAFTATKRRNLKD